MDSLRYPNALAVLALLALATAACQRESAEYAGWLIDSAVVIRRAEDAVQRLLHNERELLPVCVAPFEDGVFVRSEWGPPGVFCADCDPPPVSFVGLDTVQLMPLRLAKRRDLLLPSDHGGSIDSAKAAALARATLLEIDSVAPGTLETVCVETIPSGFSVTLARRSSEEAGTSVSGAVLAVSDSGHVVVMWRF